MAPILLVITLVLSCLAFAGDAHRVLQRSEPVEEAHNAAQLTNLLLAFSAPSAGQQQLGRAVTGNAARTQSPPVMFKWIKEAFPDLEKPSFLPDFGGSKKEINVQAPNGAITVAGKGMSALSPVFSLEADLQAFATNLGNYDEEEVRAEIAATIKEAPVVVYTYGLSPFSTEVLAILESTGCKFKNVELGGEWFLLGPKTSATRVELRKLYGQGSLPHVFIGGEWVGGLSTGANGGLTGLVERDELVPMLRKAKAL
mmetsp:Transcript_49292/g.86789  ORF Transcript_49292/g.86789 Transcript_49292/m.86789 type:complete len:256 (+) Transcript_49292:50-817(+)